MTIILYSYSYYYSFFWNSVKTADPPIKPVNEYIILSWILIPHNEHMTTPENKGNKQNKEINLFELASSLVLISIFI